MRTIIYGDGIAGRTIASLLYRGGHEVTHLCGGTGVSPEGDYPVMLWPHGGRILHELGVYEEYEKKSTEVNTQLLYGSRGKLLNLYALRDITPSFYPPRVVSKAQLLKVLKDEVIDAEKGLNIETVSNEPDEIIVTLSDGSTVAGDVLIFADGLDSKSTEYVNTRKRTRSAAWSCFVQWLPAEKAPLDELVERWWAGCAVSVYPCKERTGLLVCIANDISTMSCNDNLKAYYETVANVLSSYGIDWESQLAAINSVTPDYYPMSDARADTWVKGRAALLGDAAISYLPGSHVGASMALESASVLADELSRAPGKFAPDALKLYARRRKPRAEFVQNQARAVMEFKLVKSLRYARMRDTLIRFHDMRQLTGPKVKLLQAPL